MVFVSSLEFPLWNLCDSDRVYIVNTLCVLRSFAIASRCCFCFFSWNSWNNIILYKWFHPEWMDSRSLCDWPWASEVCAVPYMNKHLNHQHSQTQTQSRAKQTYVRAHTIGEGIERERQKKERSNERTNEQQANDQTNKTRQCLLDENLYASIFCCV